VGEAVEGALGQDGVIEEGGPFVDGPVGGDDGGGAAVALDDDLVEVAGLLGVEAAEAEVVEDVERFFFSRRSSSSCRGSRRGP
jgi:hypothetical protein